MHISIFCLGWFILTGAQFLHVPEGEDVEADEDPLAREQDLSDCHPHMLPPTWGCPTLFPRAGTISAWGGDIIIFIYLLYIYISNHLYYYIYPESCEERGGHHHGAEEAGEGLGGEPVGVEQVPRPPETGDGREHS